MASSTKTDAYKQDVDTAELTVEESNKLRAGKDVFAELGMKAPRGRPKSANPKTPVTIRLDADIVEHFKATGKGWQTRINDVLHKAMTE
ncbi:MAG: BrnA antitoxin family protein [Sneathiellales bacterium]|nr:BrnA antitoxin family protein [Sneathiellales bacterium]